MSVYLAGRDLDGVFFGKHSFFIIEIESSPYPALDKSGQKVVTRN